MKVAITGSSGQLGTLVLRRLLDDPRITGIVALDRRPPILVGGKLRAALADVRDPAIGAHLAGCDALVHLAFIVVKRASRALMQAVNVEGSKNVFSAAANAGVRSIVYASSIAAYGVVHGHPVPIVEETPRRPCPDFPYSANKLEVEAFLDELEVQHPALTVARMRPSILVGRRMEHALGRSLARGLLPDVGGAPAPLVWDEDVADAFLLALHARARGAFNVSADEPLAAAPLARAAGLRRLKVPLLLLRALAPLAPLLDRLGVDVADPSWLRANEVAMVISSAKARRDLGWRPRCATATEVLQRYVREVGVRGTDRRIAALLRSPARPLAGVEGFRGRALLDLTGPGGGDFTLDASAGRLVLRAGAPRPPDAVLTLSAALFLDLLAGRADLAEAQRAGDLRVEGERAVVPLLAALGGKAPAALARR